MTAITYESTPGPYESDSRRAEWIPTREAASMLLRSLPDSLAIRNNIDVKTIPEYIPRDLDALVSHIENTPFDMMKHSADRFLKREKQAAMRKGIGAVALGSHEDEDERFMVQSVLSDAVTVQVLSVFSYERFHAVNSLKLQALHEVDISNGLPEHHVEQDRGLLRVMAAALEEVNSGVPVTESDAATALGYQGSTDRPRAV